MRACFVALFLVTGLHATPADACGKQMPQTAGVGCGAGCGCGQSACAGADGCMHGSAGKGVDRDTYAQKTKVRWHNLGEANRLAHSRRLPILVHFSFGKQCDHCQQLAKRVFNDPTLASTLNRGDRAIAVRVPLWAMTPAERALAEKLGYQEDCLLALIDADGNLLQTNSGRELKTRGIPDAEALLETLQPLYN